MARDDIACQATEDVAIGPTGCSVEANCSAKDIMIDSVGRGGCICCSNIVGCRDRANSINGVSYSDRVNCIDRVERSVRSDCSARVEIVNEDCCSTGVLWFCAKRCVRAICQCELRVSRTDAARRERRVGWIS